MCHNKYIHTNEDVDLTDLYDLHYAHDKKIKLNGFYAIDGSNYINLLQSISKELEAPLYELEMALFSQAPELACKALPALKNQQ